MLSLKQLLIHHWSSHWQCASRLAVPKRYIQCPYCTSSIMHKIVHLKYS